MSEVTKFVFQCVCILQQALVNKLQIIFRGRIGNVLLVTAFMQTFCSTAFFNACMSGLGTCVHVFCNNLIAYFAVIIFKLSCHLLLSNLEDIAINVNLK